MAAIRAIYENGVFRPLEPVDLPEASEYVLDPQPVIDAARRKAATDAINEILSRTFESGYHDTAERHNEHQP